MCADLKEGQVSEQPQLRAPAAGTISSVDKKTRGMMKCEKKQMETGLGYMHPRPLTNKENSSSFGGGLWEGERVNCG